MKLVRIYGKPAGKRVLVGHAAEGTDSKGRTFAAAAQKFVTPPPAEYAVQVADWKESKRRTS